MAKYFKFKKELGHTNNTGLQGWTSCNKEHLYLTSSYKQSFEWQTTYKMAKSNFDAKVMIEIIQILQKCKANLTKKEKKISFKFLIYQVNSMASLNLTDSS